jgi:hypothetical protein
MTPTSVNTLLYSILRGSTPNLYNAGTACVGAVVQTVGTGQHDLTSGGTNTNTDMADHDYTIIIQAGGATFKWKKDSGALSGAVTIIGTPITLSDGVTVTFGHTTGYTAADTFVIVGQAGVAVSGITLSKIFVTSVGSGATLSIYDGTDDSGTLIYNGLTADWIAGTAYQLRFFASTNSLYVVLYASTTYPSLIVGTN